MRALTAWVSAGLLLLKCAAAAAQQGQAAPIAPPVRYESTHRANAGAPLAYRAIAGETHVRGLDGNPVASIFSISYLREGVADRGARPLIFAFNGGPS